MLTARNALDRFERLIARYDGWAHSPGNPVFAPDRDGSRGKVAVLALLLAVCGLGAA